MARFGVLAAMPVDFKILAKRGLVYVRYDGHVSFAETSQAFGQYMRHPDMRPGQKQLVDLTDVIDWDKDFTELLKIQASKADVFVGVGHETHFVYYAPTEHTQQMARMVLRSWEDAPGVIPLLTDTQADALHLLGQPERTFAALLQEA